ncbi:MAG: DNA double-strand break repair nuclease NurA [Spirulina sp. SIO3F2]|nr:DNA double-strand break repair nuclease NurA [Spirulina sp. SIO3F2]
MLDLTKLAGQLPALSQHLKTENAASNQRLSKALDLVQTLQADPGHWQKIYEQWRDRFLFHPATPLDPIETAQAVAKPPAQHSVFATDGSQIAPSHHEIAYCYLINVGRIMLHYGQSLHPLLDSLPEVFYQNADLYEGRQWGIRTEEWMGYRRTIAEVEMLAEMAVRWVKPPGPHDAPNVAMVDGSLIYWFLDALPTAARERLLTPILAAWEQLYAARIPFVGYLSASRSGETTSLLRLPACTFDEPDCLRHCAQTAEQSADLRSRYPCQVIDPIRDTTLWGALLQPGQRGARWRSSAKILDLYPEHLRIVACYVNVGAEIARVEMPAWVAEDTERFEQVLGMVLAQVNKGYGYPVALAEAHNLAVVRGGDRTRFFALLEQQMIKTGLRNVSTSYKEARKRGSIA